MTQLQSARKELRECATETDAQILQRFFKTGPGEYGEGDRFIGVRVPAIRRVAKTFRDLTLDETIRLLHSDIHEERLLALIILTEKYRKGTDDEQKMVYELYLSNTRYINNWDLVDLSAEHIAGAYLRDRSREPLYSLAQSTMLWERRISVLSTFHLIKRGEFGETLRIAEMLLRDKEDLIHKAVGWMLREVGKRDRGVEEAFLKKHYRVMPRTMLRYAIEKFPEDLRQQYLKGTIDPP
ncbi:MAG TPA: DNA alkylation repair protein [Thermoanaerobaculia bacterium]|nr:DNA alkylation repair protein [Thermoanaerobaculia bacterium]HUM31208.1 DNA alkylation repair protein [Thermoanaerobaculia bacterium]HXK69556.1 DNA alkylation repair protein [Thermoanaerobaculia bacterium]